MSVQCLQYLSCRPVEWDRIRHRSQAVEIILPILTRREASTQIHLRLIGVLLLIQPVGRRMPHIDNRTLDRLARAVVSNGTVHPRAITLALAARDDTGAHVQLRRIVPVERAQDGRRGWFVGRRGGELVGDFVDERLEAQHVAQQLALVALRVGHAAGFVHLRVLLSTCACVRGKGRGQRYQLHARHPLVDCQLVFSGKVVQVLD
jgi:hypothetical protein